MKPRYLAFFALVAVSGCGGGGAGVTSGGAGGSGSAGLVRFEGSVKTPVVAVTPAVTAYGLYGTITNARIDHSAPTPDESEVVFAYYGPDGYTIAAIDPDGSGLRTIVSNMSAPATHLRVSPDDKYVYFLRSNNLQRVPLVGGASTTILAGVKSFALTPTASRIVYRKLANEEIWIANFNGTSPVLVNSFPGKDLVVIGCPKEGVGWVREGTGLCWQRTLNLVPGGALSNDAISVSAPRWQAFDPVSNRSTLESQSGQNLIHTSLFFEADRIDGYSSEGSTSLPTQDGALEPGGRRLAVVRWNGSSTLEIAGLDSQTVALLFQWSNGSITACAYTPYRHFRPVVGPGSIFPSGVGAIMLTQMGQGVRGIAIADGTSNTVLTNENSSGVGNVVYNVSNDGVLTKLYTAYGHCHRWTSIVDGNSGLKGALVSFDADTGRVGSIVTYTRKPMLVQEGSGFRLEGGDVVEVFDGNGTRRRVGAGSALRL